MNITYSWFKSNLVKAPKEPIAKINSYHCILKMFIIYNFRSVSTKYLNNYLIWNNIKNYSLGSMEDKEKIFADFVFTNRFYEKSHNVSKRSSIPV